MRFLRAVPGLRYLLGAHMPMGANRPHYIVFRDFPIVYGRVPKVANSSIKSALTRYVTGGETFGGRASRDLTWARETGGETRMVRTGEAAAMGENRLTFAFVRDPFDRAASFYNDKVMGRSALGMTAALDGMKKNMGFGDFLERLADMRDRDMDVHLLPQSVILTHGGRVVPQFLGRFERIEQDWAQLRGAFLDRGLDDPGPLPTRNRRAKSGHDLGAYFADPAHARMVRDRYADDFELFYPDAEPVRAL